MITTTESESSRFRNILISILAVWCLAAVITACEKELPIIEKASDFELINQDNERVRLSQFRGKVVVTGFIYVKCPKPDMCQWTTKNFRILQESLGEELGKKVMFLLITFDPESDVPEALKAYGELFKADFSNWNFLTESKEVIDKVCDDYGIIKERQEDGTFRHSMITFLIDQASNVRKMYIGNEWESEDVKKDIITLLD